MSESKLLERVEAATGPDRALDELIACFDHPHYFCMVDGELLINSTIGDGEPRWRRPDGYAEDEFPAYYTSSLDAALGLIERVLPMAAGWSVELRIHRNFSSAGIYRPHTNEGFDADGDVICHNAPTPALALLAALLKATPEQSDV